MFAAILLVLNFVFPTNIANYTIDVKLEPKTKILEGSQTLTWINTSPYPTKELHFHMYLNAFRDEKTTFMRGSGGQLRSDKMDKSAKNNFGSVKISKILLNGQHDLSHKMEFIQPDDLNRNDETVLKISLPQAVKSGETISLDIDFVSKLPKIFARTGWAENDYFFVGQWFPKIGVLEKDGTWNCHQFHANTEFYSNFGRYKVNITVPQSFVIGATGSKKNETQLKGGLKKLSYEIENVHDFAWTSSPHYTEYTEEYKGIVLTTLMQPEHKYLRNRYFSAAKNSIDFMQKHIGKYPYKTLTMIDPSYSGSGSGGMEYPTLITCGAVWGIGKWMKYQELVTIHEFVHQYFQGMLASNEFENAWLDEGFTQYLEGRIMDKYYPSGAVVNLFGFTVNDAASSRDSYVSMSNPHIAPIRTDAWKYPKGVYGTLTYTKPATVLKTLENLLGQKVMDEILATYFARFQFKHPTPQDFFDVANEIAAKRTAYPNLNWFFSQTILEAKVSDYAVQNLKNEDGKASFQLLNLQNMKIPVDVLVTFSDGKTQTIKWNGESKKISYKKEITSVYIDPDRKNWLDINLMNNSVSIEPQHKIAFKYASKVLFWIQNLLS